MFILGWNKNVKVKSTRKLTIAKKIPPGKELQLTVINSYSPLAKPKDQGVFALVFWYLGVVLKKRDLAFKKGWKNC